MPSYKSLGAATIVAVAIAIALIVIAAGGPAGFPYGKPFDDFGSGGTGGTAREVGGAPEALDEFLPFVVGDIQRFWEREFRQSGNDYIPARVVVFRRAVATACGAASAATGPLYCALDRSVYLDLGFFRALAVRFRAPGDFAQAYVIAHEIGHHVQNVTGILARVQKAQSEGASDPRDLSIRLELQADCLAGVWGASTYERGLLERGDLDEGLRAAAAVGDDRIQAQTTGRVDPETWTHGSSRERRTWFLRGFERANPNDCDTFSAAR